MGESRNIRRIAEAAHVYTEAGSRHLQPGSLHHAPLRRSLTTVLILVLLPIFIIL